MCRKTPLPLIVRGGPTTIFLLFWAVNFRFAKKWRSVVCSGDVINFSFSHKTLTTGCATHNSRGWCVSFSCACRKDWKKNFSTRAEKIQTSIRYCKKILFKVLVAIFLTCLFIRLHVTGAKKIIRKCAIMNAQLFALDYK